MSEIGHRLAANRDMWDERVPIHVASAFYDVDGFKGGRNALEPFEIEAVGDVSGLDLVHLQCHFGLDTMSWARLGAKAWGLDFSQRAVDAANGLAEELGLDAQFVCSDLYDAVDALDGRTFDVVYTGLGAINWLPDLARWADVVAALVKPGGTFYVAEFHPFSGVFADESLKVAYPYFYDPSGLRWDEPGTYADLTAATEHNICFEWSHPIADVMTVLLDRGFTIERFQEIDYTLFLRWPFLEEREQGRFFLPDGTPSIPLMYSLRAAAPT